MYADPDPRHPLLRPSRLDPIRKPLVVCMLCGAAYAGAHTVCARIFADTRGAANVPALDGPPAAPINFGVDAPPSGGTALASGYYQPPPHGVVDPKRPIPRVRRIDGG